MERTFYPGSEGEQTDNGIRIKVDRKLNSTHVVDTLLDLFVMHGVSDYIRSDVL
jgi:hypothetical protein